MKGYKSSSRDCEERLNKIVLMLSSRTQSMFHVLIILVCVATPLLAEEEDAFEKWLNNGENKSASCYLRHCTATTSYTHFIRAPSYNRNEGCPMGSHVRMYSCAPMCRKPWYFDCNADGCAHKHVCSTGLLFNDIAHAHESCVFSLVVGVYPN